MTGLETILDQISKEAEKTAAQIRQEAEEKAQSLLEDAKAEGVKQAEAVLRSGEAQAEDIRARARSAAQLDRRNRTLQFKQQLIAQVIEEARAQLETADDKTYFETLLGLVSRFALSGPGEMQLNGKDLARLPADFEASLKKAAPGSQITVSKTPASIESGFLLVYGGIDINGTFRAVFEDASDELRDVVGAILFPEA